MRSYAKPSQAAIPIFLSSDFSQAEHAIISIGCRNSNLLLNNLGIAPSPCPLPHGGEGLGEGGSKKLPTLFENLRFQDVYLPRYVQAFGMGLTRTCPCELSSKAPALSRVSTISPTWFFPTIMLQPSRAGDISLNSESDGH